MEETTLTTIDYFSLAAPISSGVFRMTISAFLLLYTLLLVRNHDLHYRKSLLAIPLILLVRDYLAMFLAQYAPLFLVSDTAILILYGAMLRDYNVSRNSIMIYSVFSAIAAVVVSIIYFAMGMSLLAFVAVKVISLVVVIWFSAILFTISVYNTPNAEFIIRTRVGFLIPFYVSRVFTLFDPTSSAAFTLFLSLTVNYGSYLYLMVQYHLAFHTEAKERDAFMNQYIDSLFDFMRTIGTAMTERIDVKNVLRYVIQTMMRFSRADAGLVMIRDPQDATLGVEIMDGYFPPPFPVPAIVKTKLQGVQRLFESSHIKPGETILGIIAQENMARYVRKVGAEPLMESNAKDDTLFISSLIGIPLVVNKEVFGVASIIRRKKESFFTDLDYERAKIFVEYASLTLDSLYNYSQLLEKQEIEREVSIAASIQKKLLPGRMPKAIQNMVAAFSRPARGVSGDYYDIIPLTRAGKFALVVCDVAGKGVPASMIMVMIRTIVHLIAGSAKDAGMVSTWINRGIAGAIDIERFATMSYMTYDPISRTLEYANAGHHPAMHYRRATGTIERIDSPGLPVGLERDSVYSTVRMEVASGDIIMLYTDGIIEALSPKGEQYEEERLRSVFISHVDDSPETILTAINQDIEDFVAGARQHDDMTLIVFKAQ